MIQSHLEHIRPFVPFHQTPVLYDLSLNECPLGPSLLVREGLAEVFQNPQSYPDPYASHLRECIASSYGVKSSQVVCSNGSEELIYMLAHVLCDRNSEVIFNDYSFRPYAISTQVAGAKAVVAPTLNFETCVDHIIKVITPATRLIFLDNPGNPTGFYLERSEFERLMASVPSQVLVVLDEAYQEYVERDRVFEGTELVDLYPNLLVLRTFSKFYGLAGLRLGWGYGSESLITLLNGAKPPFNTNAFGQKMASLACAPSPHYTSVFDHNKRWRDYLSSYYRSFGFEVPQSHANFITPQFFESSLTEDYKAYLESHDIRVLSLKGWDLPTRLRISLGSDEALEALMGSTEMFMSTLKMAA